MADETRTILQMLEERERKGYMRGCLDTDRKWRQRLIAFARENAPESHETPNNASREEEERAVASAKDTVLQVVQSHPEGLTGVGVVNEIRKMGLDIPERTIRTSLRRLRLRDKKIERDLQTFLWKPLSKANEEVR